MRRALSLALVLGACGGVAVVDGAAEDPPDEPGGGGSSSEGGAPPTTPHCQTVATCCAIVCDFATTLPCWQADDGCECGLEGSGDTCMQAWLELVNCLVDDLESAAVCHGGDVVLDCDACGAKRLLVDAACGGNIGCSTM